MTWERSKLSYKQRWKVSIDQYPAILCGLCIVSEKHIKIMDIEIGPNNEKHNKIMDLEIEPNHLSHSSNLTRHWATS